MKQSWAGRREETRRYRCSRWNGTAEEQVTSAPFQREMKFSVFTMSQEQGGRVRRGRAVRTWRCLCGKKTQTWQSDNTACLCLQQSLRRLKAGLIRRQIHQRDELMSFWEAETWNRSTKQSAAQLSRLKVRHSSACQKPAMGRFWLGKICFQTRTPHLPVEKQIWFFKKMPEKVPEGQSAVRQGCVLCCCPLMIIANHSC